ncbi:MAG: DUF4185 domain-containing protein [Kiritimatiellae bacterium]|nr:DUF4185 domain-containing protein [Kiritimatiellia bacterium]
MATSAEARRRGRERAVDALLRADFGAAVDVEAVVLGYRARLTQGPAVRRRVLTVPRRTVGSRLQAPRRQTPLFGARWVAAVAALLLTAVGLRLYRRPVPPTPGPQVGHVLEAGGDVGLERQGGRVDLRRGMPLRAGDQLVTGADGHARVRYFEATDVQLSPGSELSFLPAPEPGRHVETGLQLRLSTGSLLAAVQRERARSPVVFCTPHAEAIVVGTRLALSVQGAQTILDVAAGAVRFRRLGGEEGLLVRAGKRGIAGERLEVVDPPSAVEQVRVPGAPYPVSPVIEAVAWDAASLRSAASGSDNWPVTWARDGHLYAAWGNGGGFGGTDRDGRTPCGVARVEGGPDDWRGFNIVGGKAPESSFVPFPGKPTGILCVDGVLYMGVLDDESRKRVAIFRSADHGRTWQGVGGGWGRHWHFDRADGAFIRPSFLQFGPGYRGARDDYVYMYGPLTHDPACPEASTQIALLRVHRTRVLDEAAYEYFVRLDTYGAPAWSKRISQRGPVLTDPKGVGDRIRIVYNPGIRRYLLTAWHGSRTGWGLFDAPEPWGPWTTAAYLEDWLSADEKYGFALPQKWMSADGTEMVMLFSGRGRYDAFNTIRATVKLRSIGHASTARSLSSRRM